MTMKVKNIIFVCIMAFFACLLPLSDEVFAADTVVTLSCVDENVKIPDMKWNIYRVGERIDGQIVLTGDFKRYSVDLRDLSAENIRSSAAVLEGYAMAFQYTPVVSGVTDENGDVSFSTLEKGVYLASGKRVTYGNYSYRPSPVIIEVADSSEQTVLPKFYRTSVFNDSNVSYEVKKVWIDNDDAYEMRPVDVTVDLYRDGEFVETVTLNEENDWEYRWVSNDPLASWNVVERKIPRKYVVSIESNSKQYLIKNSYNPDIAIDWDDDQITTSTTTTTTQTPDIGGDDDSDTTTTATTQTTNDKDNSTDTQTTSTEIVSNNTDVSSSSTEKSGSSGSTTSSSTTTTVTTSVSGGGDNSGGGSLPQTGQLWWPVIPLSLGGVIFIFMGIKLKPKKENNETI